jgi:predicted TIM-barrel fold metal-dependent hydrolase
MGSFLPPLMNRLAGLSKIPSQQKMVDPIDLPKALQSFYFDLTGNALDAAIAGLLTMTTPDRLLFGSDFPVISSGMYVAGVLFEHLTPAERKMVFRDNFLRLTGYDL